MTFDSRKHRPLLGFLLLSLVLHLLILFFWPKAEETPRPATIPMQVRLLDPSQTPARPRELDLPEKPPTPRTRPAKRLGPSDRQVERETAPPGETPEERPAQVPSTPAPRSLPTPPGTPAPPTATAPVGSRSIPGQPRLPDRSQLLASSRQAAHNVVERQIAEWRSKLRDQVERGEAVWLDTESDLLTSFFNRFRDGIYLVWNYPSAAAERGEEGTCLLRITINRAGMVEEVQLLESSGSARLDDEAIDAVRKGSRYYGYLPASYPGDKLTIFAFFHYQIGYKPSAFGAN
jgi:protein TonB